MARLLCMSTAIVALLVGFTAAHNDVMSRHFVAQAVPSTDVVMVAETTAGPYPEAESDYITGVDMTAAAIAGSAGVTTNRSSVLSAIPLSLTLNMYSVSGTTATEISGADVFLWQCDALGVYSAVDIASQHTEDTVGQKWLRGKQTTGSSGNVTFRTILPGWYTGRVVHFHVRVRLANASSYAVTTQLFVNDTIVNGYKALAPYASDRQSLMLLSSGSDNIYTTLSTSVRSALTLNLLGSNTAGYAATLNVGITTSGSSTTTSTTTTTASAPSLTTSSVVPTSGFMSCAPTRTWGLASLLAAVVIFVAAF
jgi:protocatechuate 3,4-dioxygenase beta subunit